MWGCVLGTVGALAVLNQKGDVISAGFKMLWLWKGVWRTIQEAFAIVLAKWDKSEDSENNRATENRVESTGVYGQNYKSFLMIGEGLRKTRSWFIAEWRQMLFPEIKTPQRTRFGGGISFIFDTYVSIIFDTIRLWVDNWTCTSGVWRRGLVYTANAIYKIQKCN